MQQHLKVRCRDNEKPLLIVMFCISNLTHQDNILVQFDQRRSHGTKLSQPHLSFLHTLQRRKYEGSVHVQLLLVVIDNLRQRINLLLTRVATLLHTHGTKEIHLY